MPKMRAGDVRMEIAVEAQLHRRLKATCERLHIPLKYLVLDALTERVEVLEEKRRAEEDRRMAERAGTGSRTEFTTFRRLRGSNLAPVPRPQEVGGTVGGTADLPRAQPDEYVKHAERIYAVLRAGSPLEARLRTMEAVASIKKRHPLTCPRDEIIVAALDKLVLELKAAEAARREDTPETVIDPSRVKTFGEVEIGNGG